MKKLGVDAEAIETARAAPRQFADLVGGLETVADTLAPLGWDRVRSDANRGVRGAARLVADGESDAAEELLVSAWDQRLELSLQPLKLLSEDQSRWAVSGGLIAARGLPRASRLETPAGRRASRGLVDRRRRSMPAAKLVDGRAKILN